MKWVKLNDRPYLVQSGFHNWKFQIYQTGFEPALRFDSLSEAVRY